MLTNSRIFGRIASLCGIVALALTTAGCIVEIDDPHFDPLYFGVADMEVRWSVNGSTDPGWCDDLGIESWLVEINGPDAREIYLDCRGDYWRSGSSFYGLDEGDYRVRLTALDFDDFPITTAGARLNDLYYDGDVDVIDIRLDDRDF